MKKCTLCNLEKNDDQFYPNVPWCKSCKALYARHYYAEQKAAGPYGLMVLGQFIRKIYRGNIIAVDDKKQARLYATYYNANITRRRLAKSGISVKIVPLKT